MADNNLFDFSLTREAEIPEGQHPYELTNIEVEHDVLTNYGIKQRISFYFDITINEASGKPLHEVYDDNMPSLQKK